MLNFVKEVEKVRLVADSCRGQNNNTGYNAVRHQKKCIGHLYLVVGHWSVLLSDRVFAHIERTVEKRATKIDPEMYSNFIKDYSTVLKMEKDYTVFVWKSEVQKILKSTGY